MKRTVGVGLVVLFAAALLAATASGQGTEPVTISIWGGWGHFEDATLPKVLDPLRKHFGEGWGVTAASLANS